MVKNKKAFLKTFEVLIAILLSFIFITFVMSGYKPQKPTTKNLEILQFYEHNTKFRNCAHQNNITCLNEFVNTTMPTNYNYTINITTITDSTIPANLPNTNVKIDSIIIAGNYTEIDIIKIRLYYWNR
ncbi:hypothetical protein GOV04_04900 [Candidatus Woesearchaeota archaeon]|nr:hypothetical protein [Candidatus Woesearchaeota archaeon]